jgi:hypothetical protein
VTQCGGYGRLRQQLDPGQRERRGARPQGHRRQSRCSARDPYRTSSYTFTHSPLTDRQPCLLHPGIMNQCFASGSVNRSACVFCVGSDPAGTSPPAPGENFQAWHGIGNRSLTGAQAHWPDRRMRWPGLAAAAWLMISSPDSVSGGETAAGRRTHASAPKDFVGDASAPPDLLSCTAHR